MTEAEFRARLADLGIKLDDVTRGSAFKGAQHLRSEVAGVARRPLELPWVMRGKSRPDF